MPWRNHIFFGRDIASITLAVSLDLQLTVLTLVQPERSEHLYILAIPSHMTNVEFYQFMGTFLQNVKEIRFVRWITDPNLLNEIWIMEK